MCARPTLRLAVSAVRRPSYSTPESTHPHRSPRATRTRCDRGRPLDNPASGVCSRVPDRAAPSAQRLFERDVIEASVPYAGEGSRAHIAGIGTPRASDTRPSSAGTPLRSQTGVETGANPSERAGAARPDTTNRAVLKQPDKQESPNLRPLLVREPNDGTRVVLVGRHE
jgi:hypothetical protein